MKKRSPWLLFAVWLVTVFAGLAGATAWSACRESPPPIAPSSDAGPPPSPEPDDAEIVTSAPCVYVEARTPEESTTACITYDEASQMTAFIRILRDGGLGGKPCSLIPLTETCATAAETLRAIDFISVLRANAALRQIEAGSEMARRDRARRALDSGTPSLRLPPAKPPTQKTSSP